MSHLFILFSGYALRPRGVAIGDGTIRFESSFKFFFAHRSSLPLFMDTVEAQADRVVIFFAAKVQTCDCHSSQSRGVAPSPPILLGIVICGCSLSAERPHRKRNGSGSHTKERDLFQATQSFETSSCAFPAASRISNKSDLRS